MAKYAHEMAEDNIDLILEKQKLEKEKAELENNMLNRAIQTIREICKDKDVLIPGISFPYQGPAYLGQITSLEQKIACDEIVGYNGEITMIVPSSREYQIGFRY